MKKTPTPSLAVLADILSGEAAARRAAWRAGGVRGGRALARKREQARKAKWREKGKLYYGKRCIQVLALAGWKVLLARMTPGTWYGRRDIMALMPEYKPRSAAVTVYKLHKAGLLSKGLNADYAGQLDPWDYMSGVVGEPRYLWQLSEEGERAGAAFREQLKQSETIRD